MGSLPNYGLGISLTPEYKQEWRELLLPIIEDMIRRKRQNPEEDVVTPFVSAFVKGVALSLHPQTKEAYASMMNL